MRKYDDEFKREAIKKIHDGQPVASVARELGCAESLLHKWKRQTIESSSDSEKEVIALRRKLREVEMERDILKKAALIFGRSE
ncbi:MAG: transposase [Acidobacteria bacterium]|nr:transposase [Acidobacteriota bacterium]